MEAACAQLGSQAREGVPVSGVRELREVFLVIFGGAIVF